MRPRLLASLVPVLAVAACNGAQVKRTYPQPTVGNLLAHVSALPERVPDVRAETKADVWVDGDRVKTTVYFYAAWPDRLRAQVLEPASETVARDLGAIGGRFCVTDKMQNCGGCYPATAHNVGALLGIEMPPEQVVTAFLGGAPVPAGAESATLRWDDGKEVLEWKTPDGGRARLVLSGVQKQWDVLDAELVGADGKRLWRIQHTDWHAAGTARLPGKSIIDGPKGEGLIQWKEQTVGTAPDDAKFIVEVPEGLPRCGEEKAP